MHSDKSLFLGLSLAMWLVNGLIWNGMTEVPGFWAGLLVSFLSIPFWALVGSAFTSTGMFLFRLARVETTGTPSLWQRAAVGLAMAVVLKAAFGIPF